MASVAKPESQRVALYARVSTEDQAEAETIDVQRDFLHRYAELQGLAIHAEYLDDGVSGTIPFEQRPGGSRLLEDANNGHFGAVLFMRVNRLGRRLLIVLHAYEALDRVGIALKSGTEPIDTSTPIGRFIFQQLGSFAELDRETIIDNTTRGRARGARKGRWYGVVPLGYTVWEGQLVPNDAEILPGVRESDLVREIFQRVAGGTSALKETSRLAALGLCPFMRYVNHQGREQVRSGAGTWTTTRITRMVHNPIYRGEHVYRGKHGDVTQSVPALVSSELWVRANRQLSENRRLSKRNTKHFHLLAGLIRCGLCGHGYQGSFVGSGRFYQCSHMSVVSDGSGKSRHRCPAKAIKADWLEREVWNDCEGFLRDPGQVIEEVRRQYQLRQEDTEAVTARRRALISTLAAKDRERQTIIGMARRGIIRTDEAETQLGEIANEQRDIQVEMDAIANRQAMAELLEGQARSAEGLLNEIRMRVAGGLDDETKRAVVRQLLGRIVVHTEGERFRKQAHVSLEYLFRDPVELTPDVGNLHTA